MGVGGGGIGLGGVDCSTADVGIGPLNCAAVYNRICRQTSYIAPSGKFNMHAKQITCAVARNCVCMQNKPHLAFAKSAGNRVEGAFGAACANWKNSVVARCALNRN